MAESIRQEDPEEGDSLAEEEEELTGWAGTYLMARDFPRVTYALKKIRFGQRLVCKKHFGFKTGIDVFRNRNLYSPVFGFKTENDVVEDRGLLSC